ncbi:hypothetical protein FOA52_003971 [Chlamydomonas sp. UWO 241]|nr:hypothetical protein FOA52_003971 [Chlamydomonas sp. UWO 241]
MNATRRAATHTGELTTILSALPSTGRQTLLFSATMTKSLIKLQAYEGLKTAENLKEQYLFVPSKVKEVYLAHVLEQLAEHKVKEVYLAHVLEKLAEHKVRSAIIFTSTCKGCHLLSLILEQLGLKCAALHSGRPQKARLAALSQFKSETVPLLLATDVASRGLDIPSVDLVINYDLPQMARDYVHRVGRTARAGRSGWSLSFVTQHDVELVHRIEEHIGHKLGEFTADEQTVLKGITKVYSAKRAAMLSVAEDEGLDTRDKRTKQAVYGGKK